MKRKVKRVLATAVILMLLPYIVTVFMNGSGIGVSVDAGDNYVRVQTATGMAKILLDEYGIGVLAREISMDDELEAVKAQAIVVRTSLYREIEENGSKTVFQERFWSEEDMRKQWGKEKFQKKYKKLVKAWEDTDQRIIVYGGKPAIVPFHQLSNGKTRLGSEVLGSDAYPYLVSKECPKDLEAEDAMSTVIIDKQDYEITSYDSAGYVRSIRFGERTYTGEEFRKEYGLASSCFALQDYEGKLRVTVTGLGHGLGMSQYTANEMAKEEKKCDEIIQYFFEGTEIKEVAEILINAE